MICPLQAETLWRRGQPQNGISFATVDGSEIPRPTIWDV